MHETKTELVTFHVPQRILEELDELVRSGRFHNRSEAVRAAIRELLQKYGYYIVETEAVVGRTGGSTPPVKDKSTSRKRRARSAPQSQPVGRCQQMLLEPDKYYRIILKELVNRANSTKTRIFSVRLGKIIRKLFNVEHCSHLASDVISRLKDAGCVVEYIPHKYRSRIVLDTICVRGLYRYI